MDDMLNDEDEIIDPSLTGEEEDEDEDDDAIEDELEDDDLLDPLALEKPDSLDAMKEEAFAEDEKIEEDSEM